MKFKEILLIGLLLGFGIGCTEDDIAFSPINQITTDEVLGSPELLENVTLGNYAFFKNFSHWRNFMRDRHDCKELMSDDVIMMRWSGDNLSMTLSYDPQATSTLNRLMWQMSYRAIGSTNVVIEQLEALDELTPAQEQLLGENIWIRSMFYFDLATVFARPYSHDSPETNLCVPIVTSSNVEESQDMPRNTVKEVYDFIEQDLLRAADLMHEQKSNIYASTEVAYATLARLYLYMERNDKAIEYADKVLSSGRYELVDTQRFPTSNELGPESNPETIFAVKLTSEENQGSGSLGTMFHGDGGWGEIMLSSTYLELLNKHKDDLRWSFVDPDFKLDDDGNKIPDPDEPYFGYEINDRMGLLSYWSNKLTYEYGEAMLYSPRYFRLAEMYLIKAEAYAKTNEDQLALDMVNIIRERAGLSGDQLFSLDNMQGYDSILDIVLDEKRLEFVLEAHRPHDVFRNKRTMDRSYSAYQGWSGPAEIPYTSNRIVHQVPQTEITQNPNLEQNPGW